VAYCTRAEVRAMDGMGDSGAYPDALIDAGIAVGTELIDQYCGTSFEAKAFNVTLDGTGRTDILLRDQFGPILYPRSITSATVDGVEAADTALWALYPEGQVVQVAGTFTATAGGRNVVIAGTAGVYDTPPEQIKHACRLLARAYCVDSSARVHDRALNINNEFGQIVLAQPGGPGRPTGLPEVNAILNRYRFRAPVCL